MCYRGCNFERYPNGPNEGCHCALPWGVQCPYDAEEDEDQQEYEEDDDCEDDYAPTRRRLDPEERYWPEWAFRRV